MACILDLVRRNDGLVDVQIGDLVLATFDPLLLLHAHPLIARDTELPLREGATNPVVTDATVLPIDPQAYGEQVFAALGGASLLPYLPSPMPDPTGYFAIRTADDMLHAIPWEYLRINDDYALFEYGLVRLVPGARLPAPPAPNQRWRLIVQGSDPLLQAVPLSTPLPDGANIGYARLPRLQVVQELDLIRTALERSDPPLPLIWQRIGPTSTALLNLAPPEPQWYHYTGHGDILDGTPLLCFDSGTGLMDPRPVRELTRDLRGRVYGALLNACRTAEGADPSSNLALRLVRDGIPVVVGTQASVLDRAAAPFAHTFYQQLAAGRSPLEALYRARRRLQQELPRHPRDWAIPVLYLAEGWSWPTLTPAPGPLRVVEPPLPQIGALQDSGAAHFIGRAREVVEIASMYIHHHTQIVTIRGTGGMGKTALAAELARRLRWHFIDGIYAVTLAGVPTLSAVALRGMVAPLLGLDWQLLADASVEAQEQAILQRVQGHPRLLLIVDNFETVLWALGRHEEHGDQPLPRAPGDTEDTDTTTQMANLRTEADAIQRLMRRLADAGVHLLFTTRQSPVNLPGERLYPDGAHGSQLTGLPEDDGVALFQTRCTAERQPNAAFARQVVATVGGSPLALQLVASRWSLNQQHTEDTFLANITAEMQQATLDGVPPHQLSLVANLSLTLRELASDDLQRLLELTIIANPVILPPHGAIVWGLEDGQQWLIEEAHTVLTRFESMSLLQPRAYDEERQRATAYAFQPAVLQVLRQQAYAQNLQLTPWSVESVLPSAVSRYVQWANGQLARAHDDFIKGTLSAATAMWLLDLEAALPCLPQDQQGWARLRMTQVLRHFGHTEQAAQVLEMANAGAKTDDALRSDVRIEQAHQAKGRGDVGEAERLYREALDIKTQVEDAHGRSATLHELAYLYRVRGELGEAEQLYREALDIQTQLGDVHGQAATLVMLGQLMLQCGQDEPGIAMLRDALALLQHLGATREIAQTQYILLQVMGNMGGLMLAQVVGGLLATTTAVLRGEQPREPLLEQLAVLLHSDALGDVIQALVALVQAQDGALEQLMARSAHLAIG